MPNTHYQLDQSGVDNINTTNIFTSSFAGVHLVQAWQDLMLWERFLHQYPPKFILEIGTFDGGLAVYLAIQARSLGAKFITVDFMDYAYHDHPLWSQMGMDQCFWQVDVWSPDFSNRLDSLLASEENHPFLLLCDGGNKPKEMQTFTPRLKPGDMAAVHDWGNEITDLDLPGLPITKLLEQECADLKSLTRFFTRV